MKKARIILGILCAVIMVGGGLYIRNVQKNKDVEGPVLQAETDDITVSIKASDQKLIQGVSAVDDVDGDVSDTILIEDVEKKENGAPNEFLITYAAFDQANNTGTLTRTLYYTDYEQPHFILEQPLRFPENKMVSLLSYFQVEDCIDGDISVFVTMEGSKELLKETPQKGFYDVNLSVTNSVGDTAELPIQVEIYEDSYEEQTMRPKVALNQYIVYLKQGQGFDPNSYLDYVQDGGMMQIDFGTEEENEGVPTGSPEVDISRIRIESDVDNSTKGVYSVVYSYTSERTGYDCNTRLIVVVE